MSKNFAVSTTEEQVDQWNEILSLYARDGETKSDALARIFDIAAENVDKATLKQSGTDVEALNAALSEIQALFIGCVKGREAVTVEQERKMQDIRAAKERVEAQLTAAQEAKQAAEYTSAQAIKEAEDYKREAADKQKINEMLEVQLADAQEKLSGYNELVSAASKLAELERELESQQIAYEHKLSDLSKDAELELERVKRSLETENARLLAKIELLEAR